MYFLYLKSFIKLYASLCAVMKLSFDKAPFKLLPKIVVIWPKICKSLNKMLPNRNSIKNGDKKSFYVAQLNDTGCLKSKHGNRAAYIFYLAGQRKQMCLLLLWYLYYLTLPTLPPNHVDASWWHCYSCQLHGVISIGSFVCRISSAWNTRISSCYEPKKV